MPCCSCSPRTTRPGSCTSGDISPIRTICPRGDGMNLSALNPLFHKPARPTFGDYLPWKDLIDPDGGLLTTTDDGLLCTWQLEPFDLASLPEVLQGHWSLRVNEAFKRASPHWAYWVDGKRREVTTTHRSPWPDPVSSLIDDEYQREYTRPGARFDTEVYLTAWHHALKPAAHLLERLVYPSGEARQTTSAEDRLRLLVDAF